MNIIGVDHPKIDCIFGVLQAWLSIHEMISQLRETTTPQDLTNQPHLGPGRKQGVLKFSAISFVRVHLPCVTHDVS